MTDQVPIQRLADEHGYPQGGSSLVPLYVVRRMKVYALHESEFDSLSRLNGQAMASYSVASFCLSAALSVWINVAFYTDVPPAAFVMKMVVAPLRGPAV